MDLFKIARIWRNGCIIQSDMLKEIEAALNRVSSENILIDPYFVEIINRKQINWRHTIITALQHGIPVPVTSSALSFFDSFRSEHLPSNLIQAQRDYFGVYGFEKLDAPRGVVFHMG